MVKKRLKSALWNCVQKLIPSHAALSYSQHGEDMLISWLTRGQNVGFYVDVGAFHPVILSNTYALYCRGWRGINVEPRPETAGTFEAFRPRDKTITAAIDEKADPNGRTLFVFEPEEFTTLDRSRAEELQGLGRPLLRTVEVPVRTLADVLSEHLPSQQRIDVLNVDVEGLDDGVLRGNDWSRFRPRIIAVERLDMSFANLLCDKTIVYLFDRGYEVVAKCGPTLILDSRTQS